MEQKTSLELITILAARHRDKQSVKKLLQYCVPWKVWSIRQTFGCQE